MNLKKLFFMLTFFVLLGTTAFAQTTYFVNNSTGLDGYNGLSATVTGDPGVGPKLTINNAIAAAVNGDVISVANTGTAYADLTTGGKTLTFTSTAGSPVVNGMTFGAATVFTGGYTLAGAGTLTLTTGAVTGAGNITINTGGTIVRAAGSLDAAPTFAGTLILQYNNTATIGPEFPTATTVLSNLTVNGAITVTVNASRQMNGLLTVSNAGGTLALGANTLTIANTTATRNHDITGAVTATAAGGFVVSTTTGNVTFINGGTLSSLTTSATTGLIDVNGPVAINGSVTVNSGNTTLSTPTTGVGLTGSLTNNGTGTVTVVLTMTIGGNVSNTSSGFINFPAAAITVTGNVSNSGTLNNTSNTTQVNTVGNINFGAGTTIINGTVTNSKEFTGTTSGVAANAGGFNESGKITFAATTQAVTITGLVTNSATSSFTLTGTAPDASILSGNGRITFAKTTNAGGDLTFTGGVTNSSSGFSFAGTVGNGTVFCSGRTSAAVISGSIANNSSNTGGILNGNIDFTAAATGAVTVTGSVTMDTSTGTGDIILGGVGGGATTISGAVSNARAATGALITFTNTTTNVSVASLSQTGTGQITFASTTGTITVATGGSVTIGSGTISTTSTTGNITVNGNFTQTGGTFSAPAVGAIAQIAIVSSTNAVPIEITTLAHGLVSGQVVTIAAHVTNTNANGRFRITVTSATTFTLDGSVGNGVGGATGTVDAGASNLSITGALSISGSSTFNHGSTSNTGGDVSVGGDFSFTGGTINLGTGGKNFYITGATSTISAGVTFTGCTNTFLVFNRGTSAQTLSSATGVIWPGYLNVNNTFPNTPTWTLQGGNFTVGQNVVFAAGGAAGGVNLGNFTLFVQGVSAVAPANFTNNLGYTGGANGFVSMAGAGAQTIGGTANFYNIEVDNAAGATFTNFLGTVATYTITGTFNLTNGTVAVGAGSDVIAFNNATTAPTIVRNAGAFGGAPTFTSDVSVVYIGASKTFSNEVPTGGSNKLVNLTIATTGASTVTANIAFEFKGTLTINTGQTFDINSRIVTSNGASIVANGTGTWASTTGYLNLNRAAGTVVTTAVALPEVRVAASSTGNTLSGTGISIGTNQDLTLANGTAAVTITFTGAGPHVRDITTQNANNTITLGSNVVMSRNLVHANGSIVLGAFNLSVAGAAPSIGTASTITGTGTLIFNGGVTTFTLGGVATIAANVQMNLGAAGNTLTLAGAALTLTGNVTLTRGTLTPTTGININGSALNLTANSSVAGAGVLTFAPTGTLTVTLAGATTFDNLTVNGNVTLAGTAGALTVTNVLTHTSGLIDFAARDLIVGTLTRGTAGTYSATTGYLQVNAAFTQGTGFSIPNLRINALMTIGTAQNFVVTNNLYLANGVVFTHTLGGSPRLSLGVAAGTVPTVTIDGSGNLDVAPTFAQGTANYVFTLTNATAIAAGSVYWPNTPTTLANNVTASKTGGGGTLDFNASRTINGNLTLTSNALNVATGITLTLATSGATITRSDFGTITLAGTGALSAANVNLVYTPTVANAVAPLTANVEYTSPTVVNNVTVNPNITLTIANARTIAGNLVANFDVTVTANTTINGTVTVAAGQTLTVTGAAVVLTLNGVSTINGTLAGTGSANFSQNVTLGALTNTGTIGFVGATGQTVTVPTGGATLTNMTVNMTGLNPALNVAGGNLTIANAGTLTFINGIVNVGANTLILARPTVAANSGLGFSRAGVTGTNVGHVVGNVQRAGLASDGGTGTNGRFEFPVGTLTGQYRPASITFTPAYILGNPVNIIVSHVDASPQGTVGLPLNGGNGVTVGAYPNFYWLVSTTPTSVTSTQNFDLDLQANNIGVPYTSDASLRMLRRQDGSATSNAWSLQGTAANYSNYQVVVGTDTTVVVRTVSAQGGLVSQGSRFSLGVPSRAPNFTAPVLATFTVAEGATSANTIQFTAAGLNVNDGAVTYSKVSGPAWAAVNATTGLATLTPGYTDYSATAYSLVVRATTATSLMTSDKTVAITVTNTNRAPVFTPVTGVLATANAPYGTEYSFNYGATDADAETLTYSLLTFTPASTATGAAVPTVTAQIGGLGKFTWTPTFADLTTLTFTATIQVTDGTTPVTTTTVFTVTAAYNLGDVTLSGGNPDGADALAILKHVVNNPALSAEALTRADVNNDTFVNAYDAYYILFYVANNNTWPTSKVVAASGQVEFGNIVPSANNTVTIPVTVMNTKGINSVSFEADLNGNGVEVKSVKMSLPSDWIVVSNTENGKIQFAAAGLSTLTESTIANIEITKNNKETVATLSGNVILNSSLSSDISAKVKEIPTEFTLSQNYPNPFNPTTTIKYSVINDVHVNLIVYDILGRVVKTLVDSQQEAGYYTISWNGTNNIGSKVASGIYIYRIQAGSFIKTVKMNLMK